NLPSLAFPVIRQTGLFQSRIDLAVDQWPALGLPASLAARRRSVPTAHLHARSDSALLREGESSGCGCGVPGKAAERPSRSRCPPAKAPRASLLAYRCQNPRSEWSTSVFARPILIPAAACKPSAKGG